MKLYAETGLTYAYDNCWRPAGVTRSDPEVHARLDLHVCGRVGSPAHRRLMANGSTGRSNGDGPLGDGQWYGRGVSRPRRSYAAVPVFSNANAALLVSRTRVPQPAAQKFFLLFLHPSVTYCWAPVIPCVGFARGVDLNLDGANATEHVPRCDVTTQPIFIFSTAS